MTVAHITTADPLGFASAGVINLVSMTPSQNSGVVEVLGPDGVFIAAAVKKTKPLDQLDNVYELLDTASLAVIFGAILATNYLPSTWSCNCGPEKYPEVALGVIKPSAAGLLKANAAPKTVTAVGGFGIVNKWGATSTKSFVSSQSTVEQLAIDVMDEASGDFAALGIYRYGFKQSCTVVAYGPITPPVGATVVTNGPTAPTEARDQMQTYTASWWTYL